MWFMSHLAAQRPSSGRSDANTITRINQMTMNAITSLPYLSSPSQVRGYGSAYQGSSWASVISEPLVTMRYAMVAVARCA
jgi:hypothetical protein